MKTILQIIFILICWTNCFSQNNKTYIQKEVDSIDLCKINNNLVGQNLKIYHNGGIYSTANGKDSKFIEWKNEEIKTKAGKSHWKNFEPKTGDIGEVIQIGKTKYDELIYILKIDSFYVPIKCNYLTQESNLSSEQELQQRGKEIEQYGEGNCNFKKNGFNGVGNRAGIVEIDKLAENYACNLRETGIDTIMLIKLISDNGSSPNEIEYIFWYENGQGFKTTFKNNKKHKPTQTEIEKYDWKDILNYYNQNVKGSELIFPQYFISHWTNLIIQLYQREEFYSYGMQLAIKKEDEDLPNVKFVRYIEQKINEK